MNSSGQAILGVLAAVLSAFIVFGSLALSLAEGEVSVAFLPSPTATSTQPIPTQKPGEPTFTPSPSPVSTATQITPSGVCQPPQGWMQVEVNLGDDWSTLAQQYATTPEELIEANCTEWLPAGSIIWVPPVTPTATWTNTPEPTAIPYSSPVPEQPKYCPRPYGWVDYYVRSGDNLYRIGTAVGISYKVLMVRNCLTSTVIYVGQRLYVPYVPVPTVYIPPTPVYTATVPPVATNTPIPPTSTRIPPTTQPPPVTTEPPPATTEPPPTTTEPPVTTEPPPATTEPPPATTEPPPVTIEPPPATTEPPPIPTEPPPVPTEPPPLPAFWGLRWMDW